VTRFFIPLIDVLTLLFASFLLLPVLKAKAETEKIQAAARPALDDAATLQRRLVVRILAIEKVKRENGTENYELVYRNPNRSQGVPVMSDVDAHELIARDQKNLGSDEQLYYLVLIPRDNPLLPTTPQVEKYREWFQGVALGFEDRRTGKTHKERRTTP
jgi:hypothetical protein